MVAEKEILGPSGQPARLSVRGRDQSVMGAYDGVFASSYRFAPFNPDALLSARGYQILRDQLTQTAVLTPLNIVRTHVLGKPWEIQPNVQDEASGDYAEAKLYADSLDYHLRNIVNKQGQVQDFRHVLWELASAVHYGFRLTEILWRLDEDGPYAGKWGFRHFSAKPCKQIGFDLDVNTLEINNITSYTPLTGYQLDVPLEKCLLYTFMPEDGLPYGIATGRATYKHSWSLDNLYRFWNICLEVFGTPFLIAKAAPNSDQMKKALEVLKSLANGGKAVFPSNVEIQMLEQAVGGETGFLDAIEHHIRQIAYAYEHAVLTSGEGEHGATSAGSDVHQDTADYQHCFVRTDLENVINQQLIPRYMRYNWGPKSLRLMPRLSLGQWDSVDMQLMASAFSTHISSGVMHPSEPQIRAKSGLKPITPQAQQAMDQDKYYTKDLQDRQLSAKGNNSNG